MGQLPRLPIFARISHFLVSLLEVVSLPFSTHNTQATGIYIGNEPGRRRNPGAALQQRLPQLFVASSGFIYTRFPPSGQYLAHTCPLAIMWSWRCCFVAERLPRAPGISTIMMEKIPGFTVLITSHSAPSTSRLRNVALDIPARAMSSRIGRHGTSWTKSCSKMRLANPTCPAIAPFSPLPDGQNLTMPSLSHTAEWTLEAWRPLLARAW